MKRFFSAFLIVVSVAAAGCGYNFKKAIDQVVAAPPVVQPVPPAVAPPVSDARTVAATVYDADTDARIIGAEVTLDDHPAHVAKTNADGYATFQLGLLPSSQLTVTADNYATYSGHVDLPAGNYDIPTVRLHALTVPLPGKDDFIRNYQGNFGSIKVPGCGFYNDSLFDPVVLLGTWVRDKACFEKAMAAHAERNDNRVVVDPRSDYHDGQGGALLDLWHDPAQFRAFLLDVRRHVNALGEHFEVLLFNSADGHIPSFLVNGAEGVPDPLAESHFEADVRAMAAATRDLVAGTATCWECRHQRNYITPGAYGRIGKIVAREYPKAWHGQHLVSGSSSWSSWNCDPASADAATQNPPCTVANSHMEGDDPYRGNELLPWTKCAAEGWCDGILYQFHVGDDYLNPDNHPNYTGQPGALGRFFEIAVRMGKDPWSLAAKRGSDPRWPLNGGLDVLAFENIYDAYNDRSTEAYGIAFCKRALAIGGWGCGSASYRRPR